MKIKTLKQAEMATEAARNFYADYIRQAAEKLPGGMEELSKEVGLHLRDRAFEDSYVSQLLRRGEFAKLRRTAIAIKNMRHEHPN